MASPVKNSSRPAVETLPPGLPTALALPESKYIRNFKPWMVGKDTIGTLVDKGWSLGIHCRHCGRTVECTPTWLQDRFGERRQLKLVDLLPRLSCAPPKGCGEGDLVIFPYCEMPEAAPTVQRQAAGLPF